MRIADPGEITASDRRVIAALRALVTDPRALAAFHEAGITTDDAELICTLNRVVERIIARHWPASREHRSRPN